MSKPKEQEALVTGRSIASEDGAAFKVVRFSLSQSGRDVLTSRSGITASPMPVPKPPKNEPVAG